jgi:hypothetical protein
MNDNSYGSICCGTMQLAQWTSIFGPGDETKSASESDEDDGSKFWFAEPAEESSRLQRQLAKPVNGTCDPDTCRRTASGICVDRTRCTNHCKYFATEKDVLVPFRVFDCNPTTCKQLVCGQCTRCTDHCTCKWDIRIHPDRADAKMQALRKKFTGFCLRRKGEF